jgi:polysaccharide pyruvyl transferase WcaK-like protein
MGTPVHCLNRGVLALAASLVGLVLDELPDARIALLLGTRYKTPFRVRVGGTVREIPVVNYRLSARSNPREHLACILPLSLVYRLIPISALRRAIRRAIPWIREIAEADFVGDIRGGDSFSDIYGMYPFLEGFGAVLAVILVRGEIVLLPQTYGPFSSRTARAIARWIFKHSATIMARDRQSDAVLGPLLGDRCREVVYCPDVAFALQAERPRQFAASGLASREPGGVIVGLNVNGMIYSRSHTRNNMFGLKMNYESLLPELIRALLQVQGIELLLVPHTYGWQGIDSDSDASMKVRDALPIELQRRIRLVTADYDQHELKGIIGTCDFFIGSRMHACIAALSQSIPCVGIAYSHKFKGVFDSVGMADWVVDGRTVDNPTAVKRVMSLYHDRDEARKILRTRVEQVRGQLRLTFARLLSATVHGRATATVPAPVLAARRPSG